MPNLPPVVIFDLDGTLANVEHRKHLVDGTYVGYHRFHCACVDDTLRSGYAEIAKALNREGYEFWVVTSRPIEMQAITVYWFRSYMVHPDRIVMRPVGNTQTGAELKRAWLHDGTIPKERVALVFEDKDADVAMWREEGLACFQVNPCP